jgi:hypothetical protein
MGSLGGGSTKPAIHLLFTNEEEVTTFVISVANIRIYGFSIRTQQYRATYQGVRA